METLRWSRRPELRAPVMIAAFGGWNDAGDAATGALRHLSEVWATRSFCEIDPEELFDFTESRPQVMVDREPGGTGRRTIVWPANTFEAGMAPTIPASGSGPEAGSRRHRATRDVVLLHGTEPQLRWRTFCGGVVDVACELGVETVVTVGSLLADVTHRRPVRVTGTAADPRLAEHLGLVASRYEGPTGIVGVLHDALAARGIPAVSLWASVPYYVAQAPSPKATQALIARIGEVTGIEVDTTPYDDAVVEYERRIEEVVAEDEVARAYVDQIEREQSDSEAAGRDETELPPIGAGITAERIAEEAERFLRHHRS